MEESNNKKVMAPKTSSNITSNISSCAYRGVTWHRSAMRYEANIWDKSFLGHKSKGKTVYIGGYDQAEKAARAHDLAALIYWGPSAITNFRIENYVTELDKMKNMTKNECLQFIRRTSTCFSRGRSVYRGVQRIKGQWQARIWSIERKINLHLGSFDSEEEAAEAYDIAAIKLRGEKALTNFPTSRYDIKGIMNMNTVRSVGRQAKRTKVEVQNKERNVERDGVAFSLSGTNVESTGNMSFCTDSIAPATINGHVATSKKMPNTNREVTSTSLAAPSSYTLFGINIVESTGKISPYTDYSVHTTIYDHAASKTMTNINESHKIKDRLVVSKEHSTSAGHEKTVPDTNYESNYLQVSENQLTLGVPCQTPVMFNIWSDLRMPKF